MNIKVSYVKYKPTGIGFHHFGSPLKALPHFGSPLKALPEQFCFLINVVANKGSFMGRLKIQKVRN
jgi:hypothetical protein